MLKKSLLFANNTRIYGIIVFFCCGEWLASDPPRIQIGGGVCNIVKGEKTPMLQFEYRSDTAVYKREYFSIQPLFGALFTTRGVRYLFGGLGFDVFLGQHCAFTPTFAPGLYIAGGGKRLGTLIEYRSAAELSYIFPSRRRLGLQFSHISNGGMSKNNPGTECLVLFYGINL